MKIKSKIIFPVYYLIHNLGQIKFGFILTVISNLCLHHISSSLDSQQESFSKSQKKRHSCFMYLYYFPYANIFCFLVINILYFRQRKHTQERLRGSAWGIFKVCFPHERFEGNKKEINEMSWGLAKYTNLWEKKSLNDSIPKASYMVTTLPVLQLLLPSREQGRPHVLQLLFHKRQSSIHECFCILKSVIIL